MNNHETKILQVLDMNSEGIGICKDNGMVIFVPETVTGDTIEAEILSMEKNYAKAACKRILEPSAFRREPECPWYRTCGGCTLGHITREKELNIKENTVRQAFRRMHLAGDDSVFRPIRAGKETGEAERERARAGGAASAEKGSGRAEAASGQRSGTRPEKSRKGGEKAGIDRDEGRTGECRAASAVCQG